MTKKHYEAIADVIRVALGAFKGSPAGMLAIETVAEDLALYFRISNPKFQTRRFLKSCGL